MFKKLSAAASIAALPLVSFAGVAHAADPATVSPQATATYVAPASAVRGDFNGDGLKDELMVNNDGMLVMHPGRADGTWGPEVGVGASWGEMDWIGSVGDLNGDGYQDFIARNSVNGNLYAYFGNGGNAGSFGIKSQMQIGNGWGEMDMRKMTVIPQFTYGKTSLLAVNDVNKMLYRYDFSGGKIAYQTAIGNGWGDMVHILGGGDINNDGIGDLAAINTAGDYLVYPGTGKGATWGGPVKTGWGWNNFVQVTNNGDATGDGYGEVIAVDPAGTVYQYSIKPNWKWAGPVKELFNVWDNHMLVQ